MDFDNKYIDELIDIREDARANKDWKLSDEIRNNLDTKLVFVFDTKDGQEVWYLPEHYFRNKDKKIETIAMSERQYVEYRIREDARREKEFESWLFSTKSGK